MLQQKQESTNLQICCKQKNYYSYPKRLQQQKKRINTQNLNYSPSKKEINTRNLNYYNKKNKLVFQIIITTAIERN